MYMYTYALHVQYMNEQGENGVQRSRNHTNKQGFLENNYKHFVWLEYCGTCLKDLAFVPTSCTLFFHYHHPIVEILYSLSSDILLLKYTLYRLY